MAAVVVRVLDGYEDNIKIVMKNDNIYENTLHSFLRDFEESGTGNDLRGRQATVLHDGTWADSRRCCGDWLNPVDS